MASTNSATASNRNDSRQWTLRNDKLRAGPHAKMATRLQALSIQLKETMGVLWELLRTLFFTVYAPDCGVLMRT
jgi:hypothetical protein